jgi:hypothetical protein
MITKRTMSIRAITAVVLLVTTSGASAYSYWTGKAAHIFFSGAGNFAFRVYPDAASTMTGCKDNFAYVDSSFNNYQVYVSSMMLAFATGKPLHLTYSPDAQGYCIISDGSVDSQ